MIQDEIHTHLSKELSDIKKKKDKARERKDMLEFEYLTTKEVNLSKKQTIRIYIEYISNTGINEKSGRVVFSKNPDVVKVFGSTTRRLFEHYTRHGRVEGRKPFDDGAEVVSSPGHASNATEKQKYYIEQAAHFYESNYNELINEITKINNLRESLGISRLTTDITLMQLACYRAYECAVENFISHSYSDGKRCLDESSPLYGINHFVGENLQAFYWLGPGGADFSVSDWMVNGSPSGHIPFNSLVNSKAHYNNMTNARWTRVGVGVANANGWWMYVMLFAR